MRILHVVTLQTPGNAFGGPTRVALNLARGQMAAGHDVRLLALADGYEGVLPRTVDGVPAILLPARHLIPRFEVSGITSERLPVRATRAIRSADVVHVHLMRDLITLPTALLTLALRRPLVVQGHGMLDPGRNRVARSVDVALRAVLHRAGAVCYLTPQEHADLLLTSRERLAPGVHLPNGVPTHSRRELPATPRIVFLARFQDRKRPDVFVQAAAKVLKELPEAEFVMAGPDSGARANAEQLASSLGIDDRVTFVGGLSHDEAVGLLRTATAYVLPSVDEPFPLSVLEAMSVGVPVVVTSTNGLADDVATTGGGIVADDDGSIADAVIELVKPAVNGKASNAAHRLIIDKYSIDAIVRQLAGVYDDVVRAGSPR